jgi:MFS transporter, FHS family, L-fucose permease
MAITTVGKTGTLGVAEAGKSYAPAMAMVTTLFFMWGFLTCLNDILIPHLGAIFNLNYEQRMRIQLVFFSAYFVFALPAGKLVEIIGYQRTMVVGLLTMAVGAVLFVPAANVPSFALFLGALVVLAAGITALQVAANPYVSVLGPPQTASSRLNLTQAFNSLGTTVAPYFGSLLILSAAPLTAEALNRMSASARASYQLHEAATVKLPYLVIAASLIVLSVIIGLFRLPKIVSEENTSEIADSRGDSVWKHKALILGALGVFLYVGAEVAIGSFLVNYLSRPEIGNMTEKAAAAYVSFYWGFAMIGRFIGSAALQRLKPASVLGIVAIVALLLVAVSMLSFGSIAVWTILLVGLFNSVMFPTIFTLAIAGLGPLTGKGSGLLVMAIVGGAVIPWIQGFIADQIGVHHAFILPLLCYLFIAYYGFRGSKPVGAVA